MISTPIEERTTVNRPLLLRVLARIEESPETWDQGEWANVPATTSYKEDKITCGTAFCVAGWTMAENGYVPWLNSYQAELVRNGESNDSIGVAHFVSIEEAKKVRKARLKNQTEPPVHKLFVEDGARKLLGLTNYQAVILFDGGNSIEMVRKLIGEYLQVDDAVQARELAEDAR